VSCYGSKLLIADIWFETNPMVADDGCFVTKDVSISTFVMMDAGKHGIKSTLLSEG
jgi:hypothetical protein